MIVMRIGLCALAFCLAACGGDAVLKCDRNVAYLQAREAPRVTAPDGLDDLDRLRERPMPEASPREPRPADAGCLEKPPSVLTD